MKYSEISNLQLSELKKRLFQTKQALFDFRMQHKMQRLSNMMELRKNRKTIAKLQTALSIVAKQMDGTQEPLVSTQESAVNIKMQKQTKIESKVKTDQKKVDQKVLEAATKKTASLKEDNLNKKVIPKTSIKTDKKSDFTPESKKWFSFFNSEKSSSKKGQSSKKRSFFRRKTGG